MPHSISPSGQEPSGRARGMKFVLSRVEEKDWDELLEIEWQAFKGVDIHQALFGPDTKENRERVKNEFIEESKSDVSDCWLKVVDESSGKIVSASQWKIYPSWTDKKAEPFQAPFYEGQERLDAETCGADFVEKRKKYQYGSPHVLLYILFTHPDYQQCGAGALQVQWGVDLADRLMVPAWVESSPNAHQLYASFGFRDVEKVYLQTKHWLSDFTIMKRPPKTSFETRRTIVFN